MIEVIKINWELLGARLAALGDDDQAAFFDGFAAELHSYKSHHRIEMQLMKAGDLMRPRAKALLKDHLPCLWFEEEKTTVGT